MAIKKKGNKAIKTNQQKSRFIDKATDIFDRLLPTVFIKIIVSFILTVIVFVITLGIMLNTSNSFIGKYQSMIESIISANDVKSAMRGVNSGLAGYFQVDKESFKPKIEQSYSELMLLLDKLDENMTETIGDGEVGDEERLYNSRLAAKETLVTKMDQFWLAIDEQDLSKQTVIQNDIKKYETVIISLMDAYLVLELDKADVLKEELGQTYKESMIAIFIIFIGGLLVVFMMLILITGVISRNLKQLSGIAKNIGDGKLNSEIKKFYSKDEISALSKAFSVMQGNLTNIIQTQQNSSREILEMAEELLNNVEDNNNEANEIAESVSLMSTKMKKQEEEMSKLQTRIEDMLNYTNEIAQISNTAKKDSDISLIEAEAGSKKMINFVDNMGRVKVVVETAMTSIKQLMDVSNEMNTILSSMSNISKQTQLLSLNASIEAARAGAEGKSFGVVAQEIRKLAENSSELGSNIGEMINNTQSILGKINNSMSNVQVEIESSDTINTEVVDSFESIKLMNKKVDLSNQSIDERIDYLSKLFNEVQVVTGETYQSVIENEHYSENIAASVEQQVASLEEINASVEQLKQLSKHSKLLTDQFEL